MGHSTSAAVLPTDWRAPEQQLLIIIIIITVSSSADIIFQKVKFLGGSPDIIITTWSANPKSEAKGLILIYYIYLWWQAGDYSKEVLKIWHAGRLVLGEHLSEGSVAAAWK